MNLIRSVYFIRVFLIDIHIKVINSLAQILRHSLIICIRTIRVYSIRRANDSETKVKYSII